ncbi:permease YjgP/YjgQ family protein [Pirellula staleyi DSM 6068]|uniref:Permease YjgP/YjgQ family protein n=1 Tax=Pirellula staleyi (strain ATCC 27377 / DSM 6068 / ICPB 4128) TaxID=530564 RepID=D2R3S4_PIRSD|nr:LptF/LptG family permease [Pirellula staleyi]ADB17028.1 permease YjgP/YjgQ family protein [Pirellula staleyi DSM 6068]
MTTIDRYVLTIFIRVLLICFVSLAGLFVVIDCLGNLDEFSNYGEKHAGGILGVIFEYYSAHVLGFFDRTIGLLAMVAAIFTVTWLQRTQELTALAAAGISPARAMRSVFIAAGIVALLGAANREFNLPQMRAKLGRNAQDWLGENSRRFVPKFDMRSDILISGASTVAKEQKIVAPNFLLPDDRTEQLPVELVSWGRAIQAREALYQPATDEHPSGYLMRGVTQPLAVAQLSSVSLHNEPTILAPRDHRWLAPDECFVSSVVTFEQLAASNAWRQYLSTYELVTGLKTRTIQPGADIKVTLHARLVQPLLDMTLLFLGLPLVLTKGNRNIFLAAAICLLLVGSFFIVVMTCHSLGSNYLLSPTMAAWLPLLIFGPLAYATARPMWD